MPGCHVWDWFRVLQCHSPCLRTRYYDFRLANRVCWYDCTSHVTSYAREFNAWVSDFSRNKVDHTTNFFCSEGVYWVTDVTIKIVETDREMGDLGSISGFFVFPWLIVAQNDGYWSLFCTIMLRKSHTKMLADIVGPFTLPFGLPNSKALITNSGQLLVLSSIS